MEVRLKDLCVPTELLSEAEEQAGAARRGRPCKGSVRINGGGVGGGTPREALLGCGVARGGGEGPSCAALLRRSGSSAPVSP